MKYEILLNDAEVEEILNLDIPFGERIDWFRKRYNFEDILNNPKIEFIFSLIQGDRISGNIKNNPKDLKCPNCNGKYVVSTYVGDFYYRLVNGTKEQIEQRKKEISKLGLHCNPWAVGDYYTRNYECLNCGIKWNGQNENIYRDISELKKE